MMRRASASIALCLVFCAATVVHAGALADLEGEQTALFERIAPAVVYIASGGGIGSGFFVRENLIVTNAHVVGEDVRVDVVTRDGKKLRARVIAKAPERVDLALLKVDYKSLAVLRLGTSGLSQGSWVASVGHGVDSPWSFTTGMVSNVFKKKRTRPVFQTQIPLNPGNSGGPIVDRTGSVIGVVTSGIRASNSVNFAIHSAELIKSFPEYLGQSCECLRIEATEGVPVLVDGEYAGVGPLLLVPVTAGNHEVTATTNGVIDVRTVRYPKIKRVDFR